MKINSESADDVFSFEAAFLAQEREQELAAEKTYVLNRLGITLAHASPKDEAFLVWAHLVQCDKLNVNTPYELFFIASNSSAMRVVLAYAQAMRVAFTRIKAIAKKHYKAVTPVSGIAVERKLKLHHTFSDNTAIFSVNLVSSYSKPANINLAVAANLHVLGFESEILAQKTENNDVVLSPMEQQDFIAGYNKINKS